MNSAYWLILLGYLVGSFPSAYVAGRVFRGLDITQHGSGNVGGTNALRVLGAGPGLAVAIVDVSKAFFPVLWAKNHYAEPRWLVLLVALAVVVGHNYSIFLRGRGGKGVATTIGASLALFPETIVWLLLGAVLVVATTRYVSLASILLYLSLPIVLSLRGERTEAIAFAVVLGALGVWRHRSNIDRLLKGTENRLGKK
ncbi:MAG: glycerol-3-phosphate 1-O-acyltransferase PlsY [Bacillota bacterium]|jgi:glycerol-3-phosphate acyltransferase PlsY